MKVGFDSSNITDSDLIYLAGIIDGEGTIGLYECVKEKSRTGVIFSSTVQFSTTSLKLMEWCLEKFGCVGWSHDRRQLIKNRKTSYTFRFSRKFSEKLLPLIANFLIIKRTQAELLIQAFPFLCGGHWNIETLKKRHEQLSIISKKIKRLNDPNSSRKGKRKVVIGP